MMVRTLTLLGLGTASVLLAADGEAMQKVQVTHTERMDFPSGGALRLVDSTGVLTVEGWDRPDVEITTIKTTRIEYAAAGRDKATQEAENVHVKVERKGDELVITTDAPKHHAFDLEYRIKAPPTARLIASHRVGEVNVDGLAGDIAVALRRGEIFLHLPEAGLYNTSAKCDLGAVNSDYAGQEKPLRWRVGHHIETADSKAPNKLNLNVKYGDIVILKTRLPKPPESKVNGL
jgi:hypothetical protein